MNRLELSGNYSIVIRTKTLLDNHAVDYIFFYIINICKYEQISTDNLLI